MLRTGPSPLKTIIVLFYKPTKHSPDISILVNGYCNPTTEQITKLAFIKKYNRKRGQAYIIVDIKGPGEISVVFLQERVDGSFVIQYS